MCIQERGQLFEVPFNLLPSESPTFQITSLPETPGAVTKMHQVPKQSLEARLSAGNCEEMIHTEADLCLFQWLGLEIDEFFFLPFLCYSGGFKLFTGNNKCFPQINNFYEDWWSNFVPVVTKQELFQGFVVKTTQRSVQLESDTITM